MLFRNLASMDVEESIRANPIDGVILMCGCDKTTPSLVMGAASCDLPALVVRADRCSTASIRAGISARAQMSGRFSEDVTSGDDEPASNSWTPKVCMSRSPGHCMTMGTASTMASMVEALGTGASGQRGDSRRRIRAAHVLAHLAGRRIVEMVNEDLRMSQILTRRRLRTRSA